MATICDERLGDSQRAIQYCEEALAQIPDRREPMTLLADLHRREGNWKQAVDLLQKLQSGASPEEGSKYLMDLALVLDRGLNDPEAAREALVQARFFLGLESNVSVSCCSSAFSPTASNVISDMTSLAPGVALSGFYLSLLLTLIGGVLAWRRPSLRSSFAGLTALFFPVALTAIISVFSLYIYEHPHHHCPFCIFKAEYSYYGYLLYLPLFLGSAMGISTGPLQCFQGIPSLADAIPRVSRQLIGASLSLLGLFGVLTLLSVSNSSLILFGQ